MLRSPDLTDELAARFLSCQKFAIFDITLVTVATVTVTDGYSFWDFRILPFISIGLGLVWAARRCCIYDHRVNRLSLKGTLVAVWTGHFETHTCKVNGVVNAKNWQCECSLRDFLKPDLKLICLQCIALLWSVHQAFWWNIECCYL